MGVHIFFWLDASCCSLIECVRLESTQAYILSLNLCKFFQALFPVFSDKSSVFFTKAVPPSAGVQYCDLRNWTINAIFNSFAKCTCCDCWFVELFFPHREKNTNIHCPDTLTKQLKAIGRHPVRQAFPKHANFISRTSLSHISCIFSLFITDNSTTTKRIKFINHEILIVP